MDMVGPRKDLSRSLSIKEPGPHLGLLIDGTVFGFVYAVTKKASQSPGAEITALTTFHNCKHMPYWPARSPVTPVPEHPASSTEHTCSHTQI